MCGFAIGCYLFTLLCLPRASVFPPRPRPPLRKPALKLCGLSRGKRIPLTDYICSMRVRCCIEIMKQGQHLRRVATGAEENQEMGRCGSAFSSRRRGLFAGEDGEQAEGGGEEKEGGEEEEVGEH